MNMIRIVSASIFFVWFFVSDSVISVVNAQTNVSSISITTTTTPISSTPKSKAISLGDAFVLYFDALGNQLPLSRKYINVYYIWVQKGTPLYEGLQKGIMMWLIENKSVRINRRRPISQQQFATLIELHTSIKVDITPGSRLSRDQLIVRLDDLPGYFQIMSDMMYWSSNKRPITDISNFDVLNDAYIKLTQEHIDAITFSPEKLIQGAIRGMAESIGDIHTTYFPPIESQSFNDDIHGQLEGIGAYVEMKKPWYLIIISPLKDSPAEKSWLLPGDRIIKINEFVITEDVDLTTAVKYIKWPAGSKVTITIQRASNDFTYTVVREKITILAVEKKMLSKKDAYLQIRQFNIGMINERNNAVKRLQDQSEVRHIILDLRNNPGWSLQDVVDVLSTIIPANKPTVNIKFAQWEQRITSDGQISFPLDQKKITILINKWTASAAEILALVIKDYFPQTSIIGEQSYGKGSVQSVYDYGDGSSIKVTIAKWFSGKSDIGIDGVGIIPDRIVIDNRDTIADEVLDAAIR